jgi:hypothetical protein
MQALIESPNPIFKYISLQNMSIGIAVIGRKITQLFLLLLRKLNGSSVGHGTITLPVVVPTRCEISRAHCCGEAEEGKTDDIPIPVQRCILRQEGIGSNDTANW